MNDLTDIVIGLASAYNRQPASRSQADLLLGVWRDQGNDERVRALAFTLLPADDNLDGALCDVHTYDTYDEDRHDVCCDDECSCTRLSSTGKCLRCDDLRVDALDAAVAQVLTFVPEAYKIVLRRESVKAVA